MILKILFAQRRCAYMGQYAPEALAVATEYEHDENPDWLIGKLAEANADTDLESARIIDINIGSTGVEAVGRLLAGGEGIPAKVIE